MEFARRSSVLHQVGKQPEPRPGGSRIPRVQWPHGGSAIPVTTPSRRCRGGGRDATGLQERRPQRPQPDRSGCRPDDGLRRATREHCEDVPEAIPQHERKHQGQRSPVQPCHWNESLAFFKCVFWLLTQHACPPACLYVPDSEFESKSAGTLS